MRLLQWLDLAERPPLLRQVPIIHELVTMHTVPLQHETQRAPGKLSFYRTVLDSDAGFVISLLHVKMRRIMFSVVHRNHDAEKA